MAAFTKFANFANSCLSGQQFMNAPVNNDGGISGCNYYAMLSNSAPSASAKVRQDITEISPGGGYNAGGVLTTATLVQTTATATLFFTDVTFSAVGGSIGPFQYIVVYIGTGAAGASIPEASKYLVGYIDNGSPITIANAQTFLVDFDATNGVIQYT